jgi:predicted DNA-binding protein (UPF0251 family)
MTRPRIERRVKEPPRFQRFKPVGIPARLLERISLTLDEFEALRLADYKDLEHESAAKEMGISRPTFTRLIDSARKKVAKAIIEGKEIFIMGGSVYFRNNIMRCLNCGTIIPIDFENNAAIKCPNCGGTDFVNLAQQFGFGQYRRGRHGHGRR